MNKKSRKVEDNVRKDIEERDDIDREIKRI